MAEWVQTVASRCGTARGLLLLIVEDGAAVDINSPVRLLGGIISNVHDTHVDSGHSAAGAPRL